MDQGNVGQVRQKPTANSFSAPGVRIKTATGWSLMRISRGSSITTEAEACFVAPPLTSVILQGSKLPLAFRVNSSSIETSKSNRSPVLIGFSEL
jgi:hypothetical protein